MDRRGTKSPWINTSALRAAALGIPGKGNWKDLDNAGRSPGDRRERKSYKMKEERKRGNASKRQTLLGIRRLFEEENQVRNQEPNGEKGSMES